MKTHYLSIFNRDTTTLNRTCVTDPTTSLLKVNGELSDVVYKAAKFIVTDGVLVKINEGGRYPKCNINETLSPEQLEIMESNYSKTTTKHLDTSDKIEAILV